MKQPILLSILVASLWAEPRELQPTAPQDGERPNIVLIFTDDQGYGDLGCYGATEIRTPHLDRMATEGMRLLDFYSAAPICSPSRAALLTGSYPLRVGITTVIYQNSEVGLNPDELTIAEVLKAKGYATTCIGKWHLGHMKEFLPMAQGFDSFYGLPVTNDMMTRVDGETGVSLMRGAEIIEHPAKMATLTKRYTEEAVRFIAENKERPFFLYLAHTMPHVPLAASADFRGRSAAGLYGDVIEELDWSAGQVLAALREHDLDEKTLVIFTSDNGPAVLKAGAGGSAGKLRGGKMATSEGGMRVPCIVRWPGRVPTGTVCDEPAMTIDLLPTIAGLVGAELPSDRVIDGKDIWPLLAGVEGARSPHEAVYYYRRNNLEAVRVGRWKLALPKKFVRLPDGSLKPKGAYKLYDLERDIAESRNVARTHADVVERLSAIATTFDQQLREGARPIGEL